MCSWHHMVSFDCWQLHPKTCLPSSKPFLLWSMSWNRRCGRPGADGRHRIGVPNSVIRIRNEGTVPRDAFFVCDETLETCIYSEGGRSRNSFILHRGSLELIIPFSHSFLWNSSSFRGLPFAYLSSQCLDTYSFPKKAPLPKEI